MKHAYFEMFGMKIESKEIDKSEGKCISEQTVYTATHAKIGVQSNQCRSLLYFSSQILYFLSLLCREKNYTVRIR